MKSVGIQVLMATEYYHQTNGQVELRMHTLKQLLRNFVNPRQNNLSGALPAIAAAMNGAPLESLGISAEFYTGQTGLGKTRPPARFPAPPHSTAWGGVAPSVFPAPVPALPPTTLILQMSPHS